jgi:hypothetical protein
LRRTVYEASAPEEEAASRPRPRRWSGRRAAALDDGDGAEDTAVDVRRHLR